MQAAPSIVKQRSWVKFVKETWFGDANLDGEFNTSDLVSVLASGTYEADVDAVWSTGDFNGDGRAGTSDLVIALADGGYEQGPRAAAHAVPEPSSAILAALALLTPLAFRRGTQRFCSLTYDSDRKGRRGAAGEGRAAGPRPLHPAFGRLGVGAKRSPQQIVLPRDHAWSSRKRGQTCNKRLHRHFSPRARGRLSCSRASPR